MEAHKKLKRFFQDKDIKYKDVAEALGYAPSMLSQYLSGTKKINLEFINRVVKCFPDVDLNHILKDKKKDL